LRIQIDIALKNLKRGISINAAMCNCTIHELMLDRFGESLSATFGSVGFFIDRNLCMAIDAATQTIHPFLRIWVKTIVRQANC
jgi:hypothetical protein